MTMTEYRPHKVMRSVAQRANALGLQVVGAITTRHAVLTYLFWRDGQPVGWVQSHAQAWLAGYAAGRAAQARDFAKGFNHAA